MSGLLSVDVAAGDETRRTTTPSSTSGAASVDTCSTGIPDTLHQRRRATLRTVDFGGQREYLYTHRLFCTTRAVYAVCVALDEWYGAKVEDVIPVLQDYMSMVHMRAPEAPMVLVFTKADAVSLGTSGRVSDWVNGVARALHEVCPQLSMGNSSGDAHYLVVSSKDGWEESHALLCRRLATLVLASSGVGDVFPRSYGAIRDALSASGTAWKNQVMPAAECDGMEEHKGVEGVPSDTVSSEGHSGAPLHMQWGVHVPIVTVSAVRDMAIRHCGLSTDADIRQVLLLLHSMGAVVYGGALCKPTSHHDATQQPTHLSQLVVLDAQWLADMLSCVVTQYARRRDDVGRPCRGRVLLRDVTLAFHAYPDDLRGAFMEVLFALDIAFPGMNDDGSAAEHIVVPALLPLAVSGAGEDVVARAIAGVHDGVQVR